jgi:hypothetical protein
MGTNVDVFCKDLVARLEAIIGDRAHKVITENDKEKLSKHPLFVTGAPVTLLGITQTDGGITDCPITAHVMSFTRKLGDIEFWV